MAYTLLYHPDVRSRDLTHIPRNIHSRLARAIENRLTTEPARYGAPLRGMLRPYWKLRVGEYRIVYKIQPKEAWILAIRHRKEIYDLIFGRQGWTPERE